MFALKMLCLCGIIGGISASAIPMWEYLSKQEKMSYLYSMFANQVDEFCDKYEMRDCNRELLKYGLDKLKEMPEDHLDTMDPYQRGAHNIIWGSMMEGHEMMTKQPKRRVASTTSKPNSYDDRTIDEDYQGQASAKIENVYRVQPPRRFYIDNPQYVITSGSSQYNRRNGNVQHKQYEPVPLTGPMVTRVHPDGTPVFGQQELPQDEDLKQYKMSKARLPNF